MAEPFWVEHAGLIVKSAGLGGLTLGLAAVLGRPWPLKLGISAAVLGALLLSFHARFNREHPDSDLKVFYLAGQRFNEGADPYAEKRSGEPQRFMNAPPSIPLFGLLARMDWSSAAFAWTAFNILGMFFLAECARRTLNRHLAPAEERIPAAYAWAPAVAVILSTASRNGLEYGQLHVLMALVVFLGLSLRVRGSAVLGGAVLAFGCAKPQTLLPFLAGMVRRYDGRLWIGFIGTTLLLLAICAPIDQVVDRVEAFLRNAREEHQESGMNDVMRTNPNRYPMVTVGLAAAECGASDRTTVSRIQTGVGIGILVMIAALNWWQRLRPTAVVALTAALSCLFIYHRDYDTVILALPLVYATARSQMPTVRGKVWFILSAVMFLIAMNGYARIQAKLEAWCASLPTGDHLAQAILVPYPVWALSAGALFLLIGSWRDR